METLEELARIFGLEWKPLLVFITITMASTNFLKALGLRGNWIYLGVFGVSLFLAALGLHPDWGAVIKATVVISIASIGSWYGLKRIVHKAGKESTHKDN